MADLFLSSLSRAVLHHGESSTTFNVHLGYVAYQSSVLHVSLSPFCPSRKTTRERGELQLEADSDPPPFLRRTERVHGTTKSYLPILCSLLLLYSSTIPSSVTQLSSLPSGSSTRPRLRQTYDSSHPPRPILLRPHPPLSLLGQCRGSRGCFGWRRLLV